MSPRATAVAIPKPFPRPAARLGLALASLLWFALSPGAADAEEPAPRVRKIRWAGVESFEKSELRRHIVTTPATWKPWDEDPAFEEDELRLDMERIEEFYRERGYYEAQASYEVEWSEDGDRVDVRIHVDEGEPIRLESLEVDFAEGDFAPAERQALLDALPVAVGERFGALDYAAARQELLSRLAENARPAAELEGGAEIELERYAARLRWNVHAGPEVRFGDAEIEGLEDVEERVVRLELRFSPGDPYAPSALRETRKALSNLQLFRSVVVEASEPSDAGDRAAERASWPVRIRVEERDPRTVRIGGGWGTEEQFRGRVSWRHRNFLGAGRRLRFTGGYSSLEAGGTVSLDQRHFLTPQTTLELRGSLLRETPPAFDVLRSTESVLLRRPLVGPWRGRLGATLDWGNIENLRVDDPEGRETALLTFLHLGISRSTLDDRLNPRRGSWLDFSLEPSLEHLGSEVSYLRATAEGRLFLPLYTGVLAFRLRLGALEPVLEDRREDVPIFKRFFSGGSTSVRGFDFERLGPLDDDGDPLGGLTLFEGSTELRFPIWRMLGGVAFFDVGHVNRDALRFDPGDVFYSVGPGLRVATPVGSLRLDVGFALRRPDEFADPFRIHFAVGHAF